jgi:hypothetical protein
LREGSRMNFVRAPEACIHDNAIMDEVQTKVAADFVDELLDLEAVRVVPAEGRAILTYEDDDWCPFIICGTERRARR